MLGIELTGQVDAKRVFDSIIHGGFIVNLTQGNTLRLLPPLITQEFELKAFVELLDRILASNIKLSPKGCVEDSVLIIETGIVV